MQDQFNRRRRSSVARKQADSKPELRHKAGISYTLVLAVSGALFIVLCMIMMPCIPDDAYISFRYSENLARGSGLTFNPGEPPVEAYSNLLWVLICAAMYRKGVDLPTVTPLIGVLFGLFVLQILAVLFRRRGLPALQAAIPMLVLATSGPFLLYSVSGLETPLFTLLLIGSLLAADRFVDRPGLEGALVLMGIGWLAAMTRPEGLIVFPLAALLLFRRRERRRPLLIAAGIFALLFVAYNAWRVSYFGEWLPTPFVSKSGGGGGLLQGWIRNLQVYFVDDGMRFEAQGYYYLLLMTAGVSGFLFSRSDRPDREVERLGLVLAFLLAAVYFNFVDWMPGMRYFVPLIPLLLLPSVRLLALPEEHFRFNTTQQKLVFALAAAVVVAYSLYGTAGIHREGNRIETGHRECRIPLGRWLRSAVPPNTLLAMSDVGATPYYSKLNTLDINTESLTDLHLAKHGFSIDYVIGRKPGVIALTSRGIYSAKMDPLHFELYKSDGFGQNYFFVGTSRCEWINDRCYWVFFRKDIPLTRDAAAGFPKGLGKQHRVGFEL
jgi:arabinofuranosyltransferase